jgi:hypothetical protein
MVPEVMDTSVNASSPDTRLRVAVYTVLVGDKEALNNPLHFIGSTATSDLNLDYFCFTDNPDLKSPVWQMRPFDPCLLPHEKASRLPKTQPDRFLGDYDYSLYIDNTVVFKRLPDTRDLPSDAFRAFRHPWRSNPIFEGDVVVREGLDSPDLVAEQFAFYAERRPQAPMLRLTAGTVLLRKHHDPRVRRFGQIWWEQILLFSKRDQLSLDICANEAECPIDYFPGDKRDNDLIAWPVLVSQPHRVLANFDADLYAWQHRRDPLAKKSPRSHFLRAGDNAARYQRSVALFHYACLRTGSSLSSVVAPRRAVAAPIQTMLNRDSSAERPIVVLGIVSTEPFSVDAEELTAASSAFYYYFRFVKAPPVMTSLVPAADLSAAEPFDDPAHRGRFGRIIVLGVPVSCHANACAKFLPMLSADGQLLIQFGSGLSLDQLERLHANVDRRGSLEVYHGGDLRSGAPIPSSVVLLWLGGPANRGPEVETKES